MARSNAAAHGMVTLVTSAPAPFGRSLADMKTLSLRPLFVAAVVALSLGMSAFSSDLSLAQEQPEAKRKIVSNMPPVYPELARKMQISGTVRVEAVITPNGKVKFTQVVGGSPVLAKAAVDAIEKWRWAPALQETKELIELSFHP